MKEKTKKKKRKVKKCKKVSKNRMLENFKEYKKKVIKIQRWWREQRRRVYFESLELREIDKD